MLERHSDRSIRTAPSERQPPDQGASEGPTHTPTFNINVQNSTVGGIGAGSGVAVTGAVELVSASVGPVVTRPLKREVLNAREQTSGHEITWSVVLDAELEALDQQKIDAIVAYLRRLTGDDQIELEGIKRGSVIIRLRSSRETYKVLEALHREGQLRELLNTPVLGVEWDERDTRNHGEAECAAPTGETKHIGAAPTATPSDDALARLRRVQQRLNEHPDKRCPKCRKVTLSSTDHYDEAHDKLVRTWTCTACKYASSAIGVALSEWSSDKQHAWCSKAAAQRARKQAIRCPTCGNESIDAKESRVPGVGTSEHITLSCKTTGCTFKEREVERSLVAVAKSQLRVIALTILVLAGAGAVALVLRYGLALP
jgi:hypothetical protein